MSKILRCDRCKKESDYAREITIPIWWYNETDKPSCFDYKTIDLCRECSESLKDWYAQSK